MPKNNLQLKIGLTILTIFLSLATIKISPVLAGFSSDNGLLPSEEQFLYTDPENMPESGAPSLPEGHIVKEIIPAIIRILLGLAGSLGLISLIVGSFFLVSSQGNEDSLKKGKEILLWTVVAFIVISISYAIIFGIIKIRYPNETTPVPDEEETSFL